MSCSFVNKPNESKKSMVAQYSSPLLKYKEKNKKRKRKLPKQAVRLDKHVANYHRWVTCGILFPFVTTLVVFP